MADKAPKAEDTRTQVQKDRDAELARQAAQVAAIEGVTRDKDGNPKPITPA